MEVYFYQKLKEEMKNTREVKDLMNKLMIGEFKQYGGDISKIITSVAKDSSKMPSLILSQEDEVENLMKVIEKVKEQFKSEVYLEVAEESQEQKARNALPGKPAIIIE
jgi:hypothetical protein